MMAAFDGKDILILSALIIKHILVVARHLQ